MSIKRTIITTQGAANFSTYERTENDYYATPPKATEELLKLESFSHDIWEPACGGGHISKVLLNYGYNVISTDLYGYGFGTSGVDFLNCTKQFDGDIVTNPPYKYAKEFVVKALEIIPEGHKVAMFLKLTFLEGKSRKELFENYPPSTIWVSSSRLTCGPNGDFETYKNANAVTYAWFVWVKGNRSFPVVKWFN